MNWEVFSTIGYISVGLWLLVPVLWCLHLVRRPRRWLAHAAFVTAVAALGMAMLNSSTHVARIQVDMSQQIQEQMNRQALARKAAENERAGEVADIRFAEDTSGDFFDTAGLDDDDKAYFESFGSDEAPAWKKDKKTRGDGLADPEDLESLIDDTEEQGGVEVAEELQEKPEAEPILMSDQDKTMADRLDKANLNISRLAVLLAFLFVAFDYVRRLNVHNEIYCPLPIPSAWADGLTPRQTVTRLADKTKGGVQESLRTIVRRGETFIYFTDDEASANATSGTMYRLPMDRGRVSVLNVAQDAKLDDPFVFETLWFGHSSFVVSEADRTGVLLERFLHLLVERRASRAHTRRTVHLVWDRAEPIPASLLKRFETLGKATGFTLLICNTPKPAEAAA